MDIDFSKIEEKRMENFKGGEGHVFAKIVDDGDIRIMKIRLEKGCSVGMHTHTGNSEIAYILKGTATVTFEGETKRMNSGMTHYCPDGKTHSIKNEDDEDLIIYCVIPKTK